MVGNENIPPPPLRLEGHCKGGSFLMGAENPEWKAVWWATQAPGGGSITGRGRLCLTLVSYWMKLLRSQLARDMGNAEQSSARVG